LLNFRERAIELALVATARLKSHIACSLYRTEANLKTTVCEQKQLNIEESIPCLRWWSPAVRHDIINGVGLAGQQTTDIDVVDRGSCDDRRR